jgi:UPF0716 protein FxsA
MYMRFSLLAFLIILLTEMYLLFELADMIGGFATLMVVIGTAVAGVAVLRRQGTHTFTAANQKLRAGELPAQELIQGMLLTFAGALLILPGLITDTLGIALLLPPVRNVFVRRIIAKGIDGTNGIYMGGFYRQQHTSHRSEGDIIDGEVVDRDQPREGESFISRPPRDRD